MSAHSLHPRLPGRIRSAALAILLVATAIVGLGSDVQMVSTARKPARSATASGDSTSPMFIGDGRHVLFTSSARNLTTNPNDGIGLNVFIRELATQSTRLVSVSTDGISAGNQTSLALGASKDASRVLFLSDASNLVPNDTNRAPDLFVRDLTAGTTLLVTGGPNGEFLTDMGSPNGGIAADGLRVVFESSSSLLVAGDQNFNTDIFQRDLATGITTRINVTPQGVEAKGGASHLGAMSASGHRVVFTSLATNLVPDVPAGKTATTAYVRDLQDGSLRRLLIDMVPSSFGFRANEIPQLQAVNVVMSPDGRYVALATAKRLINATNVWGYVFWFDLETGNTALASGTRNAGTFSVEDDETGPVMSEDGKTIAFEAAFEDIPPIVTSIQIWRADGTTQSLENPFIDALIPAPRAGAPILSADGKQLAFVGAGAIKTSENQLYQHRLDYTTPLEFGFQLISAASDGTSAGPMDSATYEFSPDGQSVVFDSSSSRIVPGDFNQSLDVFLRDLGKASTELLSSAISRNESVSGNGISNQSWISPNGRFVGFLSLADNLAGQDLNQSYDIFRRDLTTGITELVSVLPDGEHTPVYGANSPSFSADGRWVAFVSAGTNLVDFDTTPYADVFVRDMQTKVTRVANRRPNGPGTGNGPSANPVVSADGSVVVFISQATDLLPNTPSSGSSRRNNLFAYDTASGSLSLVSKSLPGGFPIAGNAAKPSISSDGKTIAYLAGSPNAVMLVASSNSTPLILHTNTILSAELQSLGVWVSEEGSAVVYDGCDTTSQRKLLIRYETATGKRTILPLPLNIRGSLAGTIGGISRDGQAAAFTSWASFDEADTNAAKDVFLARFDTEEILLISGTMDGWKPGNGASDSPSITPDGRRITFHSAASNLVEGDTNGLPDIFVHDVARRITRLVSTNPSGRASNGRSSQPSISADGQTVAFVSWADDLVTNDLNQVSDVFVATHLDSAPGDLDGDGLPDIWELSEFGDLLQDGAGDEDGDGSSNGLEFRAGTKPTQASSVFHPYIERSDLGPLLHWDGILGKQYTVEVADKLAGPWVPLGTIQGSGGQESFVALHGAPAGVSAEFYRVRVQ